MTIRFNPNAKWKGPKDTLGKKIATNTTPIKNVVQKTTFKKVKKIV